jgi:hypothetical protein
VIAEVQEANPDERWLVLDVVDVRSERIDALPALVHLIEPHERVHRYDP